MADNKTKIYKIQIDGIKESVEGVATLQDALDKLNNKAIEIGGVDKAVEGISRLQSSLDSLSQKVAESSNQMKSASSGMDELAKTNQKIAQYNEEYQTALAANKAVLADHAKAIKDNLDLEKAQLTVEADLRDTYAHKQQLLTAMGKVIKNSTEDNQELKAAYAALNQELKDYDAELGNHQRNVGNYSSALKDAKAELKEIRGEMLGFDQHSKEFEELAKKAGETADKIDDINAAIKRNASDTKYLDNVIDVAKSATAAFGLWKGAMSAFGLETKGAEEAMQDLMGAMTIIQSLQTLSDTLQSTSASAKLLHAAMKLTGAELITTQLASIKATAAQEGLTVAQKTGTIATKTFGLALKAIPFMLIISLIATLVTHWDDLVLWINKTFPALNKVGGAMNGLKAIVMGLGKSLINWIINPAKTIVSVFKKIFEGDFKGALQAVTDGIKNQFKGTVDAFNKGFKEQVNRGQEEITRKQAEEEAKRLEHQGKMIEKQKNADGTYTKEFIKNKEAQFEAQKKMYKKGSDEYNKVLEDEVAWNREKNSAIESANKKTSAATIKEYKKQQEELKKLTEELENARIKLEADANKAIEEDRKKALEEAKKAAKELENAKKAEADATLRLNLAIIDSEKEMAQEQVDAAKEILKTKPFDKKALKEYQAGMERLYKLELERIELNKDATNKKALDDLTNKLKESGAKFEDINDLLDISKGKYKDLTEAQQLMIDTYFKGVEETAVKAQTEVDKLNKKMKNGGSEQPSGGTPSSGGGFKDFDSDWFGTGTNLDKIGETIEQAYDTFAAPIVEGLGDSISQLMDAAIEEAEAKLEEAEELHDKAVEKVEESQDKISDIQDKMKNATGAELEAFKTQMAEETLLLADREAEERRLQKEKEKREKELEKQKKKQRKLELMQQLSEAIVSGALAVVNGLATKPYVPVGIAMGALAATSAGIQIATITKQISKLADGGLIAGTSKLHSQGGSRIEGTNIEVERGEFVVNRNSTKKYLPLLDAINAEGNGGKKVITNVGKYADGGVLNYQRISDNADAINQAKMIQSAVASINFRPVVEVVQIAKGLNNLTSVRQMAGGSALIN